jgi:hypothetical protein
MASLHPVCGRTGEQGMTSLEKARTRRKWRRWLEIISADLGRLLTSYDIFLAVQGAFRKNESIRRPTLVYRWITGNFAARVSIGVRRLIDRDRRTISLYRLIQDISERPDTITRQYFVARYALGSAIDERADEVELGNRDYDQFAGRGRNEPAQRGLSRDTKRLRRDTDRIATFVDKWIAHHDADQRRFSVPTYAHVGEALADIDEICCRYALLLTGAGRTTCKPVLPFDWKEPLRHPWIEMSDQEKQWRLKNGRVVWDKRGGQ